MRHLEQLQRDFQHYLLNQDDSAVLPAVTSAGRAAPHTQLAVYSNAYRMRLREVLDNDYPVLAAALGDEAFNDLATAYIAAHPSEGYSLRSFGAQVAAFLRNQTPYWDTPVLAELADFEWTLGQAFDAADDPVIAFEDMMQIAPEEWSGLQLIFHASVHHLRFDWNAPELWHAYKADETMPEVRENTETVPWVIWRRQLTVQFRSLQDHEQLLFDAARQGTDFDGLCEALSAVIPADEVPLSAASLLKRWVNDGLISRISLG